jgi:hypothetical protein
MNNGLIWAIETKGKSRLNKSLISKKLLSQVIKNTFNVIKPDAEGCSASMKAGSRRLKNGRDF